ncbi:MAG: macro domain-containing protein [bacterium]
MEVRFLVGDLTKVQADAIVNPANSEGEMGGGIAGAIKKVGGKIIEEECMRQAPIPIGQAVLTTAGSLNCDYVIHAPTMAMPVQRTNVVNIANAMKAALQLAAEYEIEVLAVPGMGTGTGRVAIDDAAKTMIESIKISSSATRHLKELHLIDRNEALVQAWQKFWNDEAVNTEP